MIFVFEFYVPEIAKLVFLFDLHILWHTDMFANIFVDQQLRLSFLVSH